MTKILIEKETVKLALEALERCGSENYTIERKAIAAIKEALAQPSGSVEQEPVTVLPDGSAFAIMSYPLSKDHWLYAERQYENGADEPNELGKPILTHALRDAVVSAVRYAIRGATNCGKELDFDPDALVQNAVYALCGPYGSAQPKEPETEYCDPSYSVYGLAEMIMADCGCSSNHQALLDRIAGRIQRHIDRYTPPQPEQDEQLNDALNSLAFYRRRCEMLQRLNTTPPQRATMTDAEEVLQALDSSEWSLTRNKPSDWLTDEANQNTAWSVSRTFPPFYSDLGVRIWSGATAIEAIRKGNAAIKNTQYTKEQP